ncbi:hypothetical protein HMI54_005493 [Coelomomyces lativittatus]|nr:hypothetical protein HMI54_005493 [Coelomomyces lativittatus]
MKTYLLSVNGIFLLYLSMVFIKTLSCPVLKLSTENKPDPLPLQEQVHPSVSESEPPYVTTREKSQPSKHSENRWGPPFF